MGVYQEAVCYPLYKLVARPQSEITGIMNGWMMDNLRQKGVMIADFAETLREYRGPDEISNIKNNDIHLSDSGHILAYQTLYDTLTEHYPEYICEEGPDVIQKRSRKSREEKLRASKGGETPGAADLKKDPAEAIRSIIERVADSEDFVYDENKQLMEMGLSGLETVEIARTVEKEFFGGREIIELPAYDYPPCIRPGFFIDLLNGRTVRSILEHTEDLPRYESAEEKAEIERTDSAVMKLLRKNIYDYLGDDMIRVTADMTFFGDLKMNHVDWYNVLYPAEVELNMRLDPAKSPSPETVTLGEIAEYAENLK
ncbi:MAG: hypothetical protein IJH95_02105 [Mogibacterium sp.]|nr:hypothetical protein [Mogibacterium sp.]